VHPRLPTGKPDYSRVVPCRCLREEMEETRLARLLAYSNLGSLTRFTFDNLVIEGRAGDAGNQQRFLMAYRAATIYARDPQGWLVFLGPSGCGKTHLAAAIANQCIQDGQPAYFMSAPDLLDHLRSTFGPGSDVSYDELFEQVQNAPLLVMDDLGTQATTPWAEEKLFQIINHRFNVRLPTVINLAAGVTLEEVDDRLRTRLSAPSLSQVFLLEERAAKDTVYSTELESELMKSMTFENFDPKRLDLPPGQRQNLEEAYRLAQGFARSPEGWLIFQGEYGCGKTHLAAAIANYRKRAGQPVCFKIVPDLLDHLRSTFEPESRVKYDEVFEMVKNSSLLILDDFGEHNTTRWAQEKLYQIINHRYNARLPMVVTMFFSLDDEEIEARIASRLADPRISLVFNITAPDYRTDRTTARRARSQDSRRRKG